MCTVIPCAHVINTEGPLLSPVSSDVIPVDQDSSALGYSVSNSSLPEYLLSDPKAGRAYLSSNTNNFIISQLHNVPAQDEPVVNDGNSSSSMVDPNPIVAIKDGLLRGFIMKTIATRPFAAFQGIPFSQPPVGQLRFKVKHSLQKNCVYSSIFK